MQDIGSHPLDGNIVTSISSTLFSQCQHLCKDVDMDMDFAYAGSLEMSPRMYLHYARTLGDIEVIT